MAVPFENSEWGFDIDTTEELLKLKRIAPKYIKQK
jgi:molybdenum cofactor cytidylyltransferase